MSQRNATLFRSSTLAVALLIIVTPHARAADQKAAWPVPMGLYCTTFKTEQETKEFVTRCKEHGIGLLLPSLSGGGTVLWKTGKADYHPDHRAVMAAGFDGLARMIHHAHAAGIRVYPSVAVCPGGRMLNEHPEWETRDRTGRPSGATTTAAVSLAFPEARKAKTALIMDLVTGYEVDGVLLDYCRYPENTKTKETSYGFYGYDAPLIETCEKLYAFDPRKVPIDSPRWKIFNAMRAETVNAFVREFREAVEKSGRKIRIGGFGDTNPEGEARMCGRDWSAWGRQGLIDDFFLATYTEKPAEMPAVVERARQALGPHVVLISALAPFNNFIKTNEEMTTAARALMKGGSDALWIYRDDFLTQLKLWDAAQEAGKISAAGGAGRRPQAGR